MKMKALAIILPALMVAGVSQAAEIYNKNGNKVDLYGKMVGERVWSDTDKSNSENADTSYARFGIKGETQIDDQLTGYGQFEFNMNASKPEGGNDQEDTRLAFAGLKFADYGSFDYGRNYGVAYDAASYTDMFVEWGGDSWAESDNFMTSRTNGVATYRNSDFFGMVEGLNFALQYQGKNDNRDPGESNGDGYSTSISYEKDGFGVVGAYGKSDRTDKQVSDHNGDNAEVWSLAAKYDANNVYTAVMYGETRNLTTLTPGIGSYSSFNKTQNLEAVVQYQFDFGLRPSLGYVYSKGKNIHAQGDQDGVSADRLNYVELGTWYYFNKNFNVYTAYKFNLIDEDDAGITGTSAGDQFAMGVVYQF